jgi:hypothetical protein
MIRRLPGAATARVPLRSAGMRKRRVAVVAVALSLAACAQDAAAPAPTPAPATVVAPEAAPPAAEQAVAHPAPPAPTAIPVDPPIAALALRDLTFARVTADGYDVRREVRRMDVRDTKRQYDPATGAVTEVPLEGTTNPGKKRQNEDWQARAEWLARRDAALLTETHRQFREMFAEPLRLAPLPADRLPLSVEVLWDRASFDKEMMRAGTPVEPFVRAIRRPGTSGIVTYAGDESLQSLDELACAGGRVQKRSDQALAAVAAKQVLREYSAARGTRPADEDDDDPPGPRWLSTGLAELLGGVETTRDDLPTLTPGSLVHGRIVLALVSQARHERDMGERWAIDQLLEPERDEPGRRLLGKRLRFAPPVEAFSARAWAFCHFLWNYDGGRYRDRFITFVGRVLDGTGTSEVFATEIMDRPSLDEWGDVEMEFEWYWSKLLERKVGRDRKTRQWYEPSTEPPSGTVDDDKEFIEIWDEAHPR